jgi:TRAP-type mannitol/chloroaromatic compound transport system substrate-binding protein
MSRAILKREKGRHRGGRLVEASEGRERDQFALIGPARIPGTNHAILERLVVMNEAFWQRLSEDHKEIFAAASRAANEEAADLLLKVETAAYAELADRGVEIVDLSRDELIAWRICSSDVISNFVEKSDDLRQKLMTAYGRLRQQPCCNQAADNIAPKY